MCNTKNMYMIVWKESDHVTTEINTELKSYRWDDDGKEKAVDFINGVSIGYKLSNRTLDGEYIIVSIKDYIQNAFREIIRDTIKKANKHEAAGQCGSFLQQALSIEESEYVKELELLYQTGKIEQETALYLVNCILEYRGLRGIYWEE